MLPTRQPYNAPWMFAFLRKRALGGIEVVQGLRYRRLVSCPGDPPEWAEVRWSKRGLDVRIPSSAQGRSSELLTRISRLFDLDADSAVIDRHLASDPILAPWVGEAPGLRIPGAWNGFETAVRAVLGQQVSVAQATNLATRLVERFGQRAFPEPKSLQHADIATIGIPGKRAQAIRALATATAEGALQLQDGVDSQNMQAALCRLPGIGPWTASYIALRVGRDPNAFLAGDSVVCKMLGGTPRGAEQRALAWAPWRGYAVMYLWYGAANKPN